MENEQEAEKSFGNISEHHWTRTRKGLHGEALDYLRSRSHDPGVREGGGTRNHYCLECAGVVPHDQAEPHCPHCGAELGGAVKRYFNWVEIDQPTRSDLRALLPWILALLTLAGVALYFLLSWVFGA